MRSSPSQTLLRIFVATVSAASLTGCDSGRPETIPVVGKIHFDDGPPPAAGAVYFAPIAVEEGYPRRPGRARFDTDGVYQATSFEEGDGLVPGEYRVRVECWRVLPGNSGPGASYVGAGFSPENLVVAADQRRIDFDVHVPLAQ